MYQNTENDQNKDYCFHPIVVKASFILWAVYNSIYNALVTYTFNIPIFVSLISSTNVCVLYFYRSIYVFFVDKRNMVFEYVLTDLLHFILTKTKKSLDKTETMKPIKKCTCNDFWYFDWMNLNRCIFICLLQKKNTFIYFLKIHFRLGTFEQETNVYWLSIKSYTFLYLRVSNLS